MAEHNNTGREGESLAASYLERQDYLILERNYRHHHAEIDLIARKGKMLIFAEVKTRKNLSYGLPEEFVSYTKAKLIMRVAEHYIFAKNWQYDVRFDIIAVTINGNNVEVKHIEDAFC